MLQLVLDKGPDLALTDEFGYTVMHYACMGGNKACFELLAERGMDHLDTASEAGVTCLMAAVKSRDEATVAAVLEQSANPFYKDCMGKDALAYAKEMNDHK